MNTGLYRGVAALSVAQKSMDSIAANLASVSTPGYKRRATANHGFCLLYTSPSPRDLSTSRMPSSA